LRCSDGIESHQIPSTWNRRIIVPLSDSRKTHLPMNGELDVKLRSYLSNFSSEYNPRAHASPSWCEAWSLRNFCFARRRRNGRGVSRQRHASRERCGHQRAAGALAQNADRLQRFEQEACLLGTLNHPNLLAIFDVGREDGLQYLVSELLEGKSQRAPERWRAATAQGDGIQHEDRERPLP
jgi:hypothetical protein